MASAVQALPNWRRRSWRLADKGLHFKMAKDPSPAHTIAAPTFYRWWAIALGLVLIVLSERIAFNDSGDFIRSVYFMLASPAESTGRLWTFLPGRFLRFDHFDAGSLVFAAFGYLQKWTSAVYFDLRWQSIGAKLLLLWLVHLITLRIVMMRHMAQPGRVLVFTALCLVFFQAHHIGIFKSFYAEYVTFFGCLLTVLGLLSPAGRPATVYIIGGTLVLGLSKVQYFYAPALLLLCMGWHWLRAGTWREHASTATGLLCVQLLCLLPLQHNPYQQLNYHQSLYFGSYMVLTPQERQDLGLTPRQQACVGLDSWGHRAAGPGGSLPQHEGGSCYGEQQLTLRDVLQPHMEHPTLLWRLARYALPEHFTAQYFHVYRSLPYIVPADRRSFGGASGLVRLTQWRDATVTRIWPVIVAMGLLAGLAGLRAQINVGVANLFLAAFILSQIAVSLLGEGIRDLSKHLWGAQLALDILLCTLLLQAWLFWHKRTDPRSKSSSERITP